MPQKPSLKRLSKFFFDGQHKFQATFAKQKRITNMRIATIINIRARTCTHVYARIARTCTHACVRKPLCAIYLQLTVFPFTSNAFTHRCNKSRKISFLPR